MPKLRLLLKHQETKLPLEVKDAALILFHITQMKVYRIFTNI